MAKRSLANGDTSVKPAFMKVRADIAAKIAAGELLPGTRLLDERGLARAYDLSRDTIRRALKHLCDEQLVERIHGSGTYVKGPDAKSKKVAAIYWNSEMSGDEHTFAVFDSLVREGKASGDEIVFRTYSSEVEARRGLSELSKSEEVGGVVIVSPVFPKQLKLVREVCEIPVVMIGDMATAHRIAPLVDQVVGSNYHAGVLAGNYLLEKGCNSLAMVARVRNFVWNLEALDGFRDVARGTTGGAERCYALDESAEPSLAAPEAFALINWAEKLVRDWIRDGSLPDGIFCTCPWAMKAIVEAFRSVKLTKGQVPALAVFKPGGSRLKIWDAQIQGVSMSIRYEPLVKRALARLMEKQAGDSVVKLEVIEEAVVVLGREN